MSARPIQYHDDEIARMGTAYLGKKPAHVIGIHRRGCPIVEAAILGAYGGIFVHELTDQRQTDHRAAGSGCPAFARITHPAEARLVLKHQSDRQ